MVQEGALLEYMETHSGFAENKFMGVNGTEQRRNQWARLTAILNALGPSKDAEAWMRVYIIITYKRRMLMGAQININKECKLTWMIFHFHNLQVMLSSQVKVFSGIN